MQDLYRAGAQRYPVLASRLHPRRRDRPRRLAEVDLLPPRAPRFPGSDRRQHQNLERRLDTARPEPDARTVSMAAATPLWGRASRCVTMSFCGCRSADRAAQHAVAGIVVSQVHRNDPPQHAPDALVHRAGRLRLHVPGGRLDLQHVGGVDLRDQPAADTEEGIAFEAGIQFCAYHRSREPPRFCSSTRSLFSAKGGTPAARRSSESGSPPDRASFRLARSARGPRRARRVRPRRRTGSSGAARRERRQAVRHRAEGQGREEHNGNEDDKDTKSTRSATNNTKTTEGRVRRETREYEVQVEITSKSGVESARRDAADEVLNKMPIGWRPAGGTAAGDRHRCCRDARERRAPGIHRWRPARPRASTGTAATP